VVHGHDRRCVGLLRELCLEPREVELAVVAAGDRGVACDEPERADPHRVARADRRAIVVVAGQHVEGRRQRLEQLAHALILGGRGAVGEVAGDDHRVRQRVECQQRANCGLERRARALVLGQEAHVRIAELGEHRGGHGDAPYS
jgi:hypothetical protein